MTCTPGSRAASDAPTAPASFNRWLLRALPGQQLEYHRGHLVWDRSPASSLAEDDRRALARIAYAALKAADDRLVHLAQRRNAPFNFSYLAIKRPDLPGMPAHGLAGADGRPAIALAAA